VTVAPGVPAANGQVLTWNAALARWEAAAPTGGGGGTLAGDVTGPAADNTLRAIQERRVDAPDPVAGQALVFDGEAWRPAFVVRALNETYAIVAAGHFAVDSQFVRVLGSYNRTQLVIGAAGPVLEMTVTFTGSRELTEDDTGRLVVKGTAQRTRDGVARPLVFVRVENGALRLTVNVVGFEGVDRIILEISRIG
jgi:hypothetical protein